MIVNSETNHNNMSKDQSQVPQDSPPSYDAVENTKPYADDVNKPSNRIPAMPGGPSYVPSPSGPPKVYNYVNPRTGERVVSLLPPDHPEMVCLQAGEHIRDTHFGLLGILAAIFWFPLGIGICLLDRRVRCKRCGVTIEEGVVCR